MWILVIVMIGYGNAIHSIEGFESRAKCETAAETVAAAIRSISTACIEQTWEGE